MMFWGFGRGRWINGHIPIETWHSGKKKKRSKFKMRDHSLEILGPKWLCKEGKR